jgi:hypothetical protein
MTVVASEAHRATIVRRSGGLFAVKGGFGNTAEIFISPE